MTEMTIEGKTKKVSPLPSVSTVGVSEAKDDITALDGEKRDSFPGKAELATRTTCNVFELLRRHDIPTAYVGRDGPTTHLVLMCEMILVEVVVRKVATGSYIKRHPHVDDLHILPSPIVEFFYKTSGKVGKSVV